LAAFLLLFKWLVIGAATVLLGYSLCIGKNDLTHLAIGLFALSVPLTLALWLSAGRARCPLCIGNPLAHNACVTHRKTRRLFGSYRLYVALSILLKGRFRCPYCGEPAAIEVRPKRPAAIPAPIETPSLHHSITPSLTPMSNGLFIVIEGIDGTGKSTQARRLGGWLESQGRAVVVSREPTDGPWGRQLRESAASGRLSAAAELEYFLNDRRQHVNELIAPALAAGKVVILDRYYFSTMAYQGARGYDPAEIRRLNEAFAPVPDLLLIIDLDVDTALGRIGARGDTANEFEQRDNLQRCRQIFLSLAGEPFARVIPGNGDIDTVTTHLQHAISRHLPHPVTPK
jgi:dTMP kinase